MENREENRSGPVRESFLSVEVSWWHVTFWLFVGQLILEAVMVVLDERTRLSAMGLSESVRFIRSELSDSVPISAVIAIALVDIGRYAVITAGWFKNLVDRNIAAYEAKILDRGHAEGLAEGRMEGRAEGIAEGRAEATAEILEVLDEDARKEVARKLGRNGDSTS